MANMYAFLAGIAQSIGLLYFVGIFTCVCLYAFWPSNRERFKRAASLPLSED